MIFDVPVLIISWRRSDTLLRLFSVLRLIKPSNLFVFSDGPSSLGTDDANAISKARSLILREIDWYCNVQYYFSDLNLGCRLGPSSAIDWFFDNVPEGIILEDDCIPHPDFFRYVKCLLETYRHDSRIWSICGSNFQLGKKVGDASYFFSIHGDSWGWATWSRAWSFYHRAESEWISFRDSKRFEDVFANPVEQRYWTAILDSLFLRGRPAAWDYQWWLASWMNHGLHAWPNVNLVSNIGFNNQGSNTFGHSLFADMPVNGLGNITHPSYVLPIREADRFMFLHRRDGVNIERYGIVYPLYYRLRQAMSEGFFQYTNARAGRVLSFLARNLKNISIT